MISDLAEFTVATKYSPPINYGMTLSSATTAGFAVHPLISVILPSAFLPLTGDTAPWVLEAVKKLDAIGKLRRGWDSYDGLPLSAGAKRMTFDALEWLKGQNLPVPAVVLGSSGTVNLEWRTNGKELELELGLGEGGAIEYVKVDAQGEMEEGVESAAIEERLRTLTDWLRRS
jgi:hypothetical protein